MPSRAQRGRQAKAGRVYVGFRLPAALAERIDGYCERNIVGRSFVAIRALEDKMDALEAAEAERDG